MTYSELRLDDIQEAIESLSNPDAAQSPAIFLGHPSAAAAPGLYSWWADDDALLVLTQTLDAPLPALIYAGQAGATSSRAGKQSKATLASRIAHNHVRGNVRASTFRHTLAALLRAPLSLHIAGTRRLEPESEARLSAWIREHLRVATYVFPDRQRLASLEHEVLVNLDPPLNLDGMPITATRRRLKVIRGSL